MEAVKTQDVGVNDLPWIIEYHADRCTMCGSCVASCSFNAIKVVMQKQSLTVSEASVPTPKHTHIARPIIKQVASLTDFCRGCGMCEKICPNNAIHPVRNPDQRRHLLAKDNGPLKRGGRTNLNAQRALDSIVVGRISQMTDPSLDAARHTFDIRAPFGRVLDSHELPFEIVDGKLVKKHRTPPVQWIYPLIFSDMSIGALSTRAWEAVALAVGYLNEKCGLPVRMSSGEGGMPVKLLESEYLKYFIIQIASGHFGWNRIIKAMPHMVTDPGGVLIKIGQGAKPGDGGLLPEAKVAEHVQAIRGVPKATLASPPNHQGLYSIDPYKICGGFFIDGIQGGTGAANEISLDHTGHPVVSKIRDCYLAAVKQGRQGQIPLYGGGGIGMTGDAAADAFKMMCLGANGVFVGKVLIQLLGCVGNEQGRCNSCNTGKCPMGICSQDPRLVKRLDVDRGAQKIVDYVLTFDKELKKLMAPIGNSSLPIGRSDALVSTDKAVADRLGIQYVC